LSSSYFKQRREQLDSHLERIALTSETPTPLVAPLRRAVTAPGKRVRGLLTMATAEALGTQPEKVLDAAAAFEMIHASSLVLDDLPPMDDAELRRGLPALHREFGEDLAILAAVGLLNHSYGLLVRNHAALAPKRWRADLFLQRVVDAVGWNGSVGGEAVDLHSESEKLDFATLEYIHSRKTGALFVACAVAGAMLANATPEAVIAIEAYAKNLGLAFQITDDILDVTATAEELGKDIGKDVNRLTFVKLAGVEGARQLNEELIDTSLRAVERLGGAGARLRELAMMLRDRTK
jgi:geranylgeranyl diphosphate synthase type II